MASNTERLDLLKINPQTDGNQTFNIDTILNENWDRLEDKVAMLNASEVINRDGS
ncbi:hypothetical protein [Bacillus sp. FSL K6-3431]|uniref:hypothetical protein n=1 Tax=Bacillus sp. FSL K6-3431 TaxID=2921500 RepID=UPI0030F5B28B